MRGSPHDSDSAEGYRYRPPSPSKGEVMAKATVEVLVDDLDGSEGAETVRIGWNGEWRELELSKKNLSALSRALDKYWDVSRPVSRDGHAGGRRRSTRARSSRPAKRTRDPKGDPCLGYRQRDLCTSPRSHPRRRGTSVQRRRRTFVAVTRLFAEPLAACVSRRSPSLSTEEPISIRAIQDGCAGGTSGVTRTPSHGVSEAAWVRCG